MKSQSILFSMMASAVLMSNAEAVNLRIIGGTEAKLDQYPFISGIVEKGGSATDVFCGASVIAPQWVLTAAHCLEENPNPQSFEVIVNTANLNSATAANRVGVSRVVMHPSYDGGDVSNDIALLRLVSAVDVAPVKIATPSDAAVFAETQPVSVAGWGNKSTTGENYPSKLHAVDLFVSDFASCSSAYGGLLDSQICATVPGGGKDSCQGDSGGPLVARTENGPVQIGIVSFGDECASATHPGVYTKVSSYGSFLTQALSAAGAGNSITDNTAAPTSPVALPEPESGLEAVDTPAQPELVGDADETAVDSVVSAGAPADEVMDLDNGSAVEFSWITEFDVVNEGASLLATAEVYNGSDLPVVLGDLQIDANSALDIDYDECSGTELVSGDFCEIDLLWIPDTAGDLKGTLGITGFDGAQNSEYELSLNAEALEQVDYADVLDLPDADFYTNEEQDWYWNEQDWMAGASSLEGNVDNEDALILNADLGLEEDSVLEFSYQLGGVHCHIYIDDVAAYELSASDDWQQVRLDVPAGADVSWEFRAATRSKTAKNVKLDGMKLVPASGAGQSANSYVESAPLLVEPASGSGTANAATSGGAGGTGVALLLAGLGVLSLRSRRGQAERQTEEEG